MKYLLFWFIVFTFGLNILTMAKKESPFAIMFNTQPAKSVFLRFKRLLAEVIKQRGLITYHTYQLLDEMLKPFEKEYGLIDDEKIDG